MTAGYAILDRIGKEPFLKMPLGYRPVLSEKEVMHFCRRLSDYRI